MKTLNRISWALLALAGFAALAYAGTTAHQSQLIVRSSTTNPTCATSGTSDGYVCAEGGLESEGVLNVAGASTLTGAVAAGSTLAVTGAATLSSTLGVTGAVTASSTVTATGLITGNGGYVGTATRDTGTGQTLTTASSGGLFVAAAATDAATTFILPAASTKAVYCFAADDVTGSNRELKIQTPTGSDLIVGTTNAAGGTGIATTAGASHGVKNTHATAVRGNGVCVRADGTNTWYMFGISGTFAAY